MLAKTRGHTRSPTWQRPIGNPGHWKTHDLWLDFRSNYKVSISSEICSRPAGSAVGHLPLKLIKKGRKIGEPMGKVQILFGKTLIDRKIWPVWPWRPEARWPTFNLTFDLMNCRENVDEKLAVLSPTPKSTRTVGCFCREMERGSGSANKRGKFEWLKESFMCCLKITAWCVINTDNAILPLKLW